MTDQPEDHLRALLGDVPAPDPAARERAIAAAMAVFEEQHAPRRRATRWLMPAAAALVGVIAVGAALTRLDPDGDEGEGERTAQVVANSIGAEVQRAEASDDEPGSMAAASTAVASTAVAAPRPAPDAAADADAAIPAASAVVEVPTVLTDADIVSLVADRIDGSEASEGDEDAVTACNRAIVTEALDQRDSTAARPILLALERTAEGEFAVVLVPEGEPDACTEIDRLPIP